MSVDAENPGRGDVAGILAAARERSMKAAAMRDAERELQAAIAGVTPDVWAGEAAAAFVTAASSSATEVAGLAARWDAEASTLSAYGRGVQDIQDRQRLLELQRDEASTDLRAAERSRRTAAAEELAAVALGGVPDSELSERYERSAARHQQALDSIERSWQALIADREAVNRACVSALTGEGVLGRMAPGTLDELRSGDALLAGLTATDLLVLARTNPDLLNKLKASDPAAVRDWWGGLGEDDQTALIVAMPGLIGNLEGVRYRDRDTANRIWLNQQLGEARANLEERGTRAGGWDRERLLGLQGILEAATTSEGHASRFLVSLTDDRPPLAAVSIGDLDDADNVTWAVPGMGSSAATLPDWARSAQTVQDKQTQLDDDRRHAVVAWVGYKAPAVAASSVFATDLASAGAVNLDRALNGFTAVRSDADLNVIAHSYGTTTAALALARPGVHVDTFVSLGSAGLPSKLHSTSDLCADHVYAGQAQDVWEVDPAPGDQWAWVGRSFGNHPVNPVGDDFGASVFGVDSGAGTAVTDHGSSTPGGTGYLDADTESLRNVALATTGQSDRMTEAIEHGPTPFQQAMMEGLSRGY
ncbi:alpha/beta hydrolase [Microbacterium lacticum]